MADARAARHAQAIQRFLTLFRSRIKHADKCPAPDVLPDENSPWLIGEENLAEAQLSAREQREVVEDAGTISDTSEPAIEIAREHAGDSQFQPGDSRIPAFIDIEAVLRDRKRMELEDSLGCPLWEIPHFVMTIWRLDA